MTFHERPNSPFLWVSFRLRGQRQAYLSTKTSDPAEAEIRGARLLLERAGFVVDGGHADPEPAGEIRTDATVDEVIALYREWRASPIIGTEKKRPRERTARNYENRLKLLADKLNVSRVGQLKAKAPKMKASALGVTEEYYVPLIRSAASVFSKRALAYFESRGVEIENPLQGFVPDVIPPTPFAPPTREFLHGLMRAARDDLKKKRPVAYLLLWFALCCGLRQQEAAHVRKRDILTNCVRVYSGSDYRNKRGKYRDIPVESSLLEELSEFIQGDPDEWVVPNVSEPLRPSKNAVPEQRAYRAARHASKWLRARGVARRNPLHWLRKCFGSFATEKHGVFVASRWLGHASVVQTERVYAGVAADKKPDVF